MPGLGPVDFAEDPSEGISNESPDDDKYFWSHVKSPDTRHLSLLLVSKQTYCEAYHIFYRDNNLQFLNVCYLWQFLKNFGYARRHCITHITFVWMGLEAKAAFRLLQRCPRLKFLDIILPCRIAFYESCECYRFGSSMLREVRGLEAVVFKHDEDHEKHTKGHIRDWRGHLGALSAAQEKERWNEDVAKIEKLRRAMMRPRLKRFVMKADEEINPFEPKRERYRRSEEQLLGFSHNICPIVGCPVPNAGPGMESFRRHWSGEAPGQRLKGAERGAIHPCMTEVYLPCISEQYGTRESQSGNQGLFGVSVCLSRKVQYQVYDQLIKT